MKIYFSCSITGGRDDQQIYAHIVEYLQNAGHEVLTAHLAFPEVMKEEAVIDPFEVYRRDMAWVHESDALIAEVTTPSHGVGYEIAEAINLEKPVFCCHFEGRKVSKILSGNTSPVFSIKPYRSFSDLEPEIADFLASLPKAK